VRNSRVASVPRDEGPRAWVTETKAGRPSGSPTSMAFGRGTPICGWSAWAPTARLRIRHQGGRYDFRPAHEGAAAAGCRTGQRFGVTTRVDETLTGAAAREPGRECAAPLSTQVGSRFERDHGIRANQQPRQTAAKMLRQGARPPVHFSGASGGSAGQQRQREGVAAHSHGPQNHGRLPLKVGR
jgi:hypothetical protein